MSKHLSDCDVLIVEDDFLILLDLQTILEDEGAQITVASSVSEGLAAAESDRYSAALLDVRLPDGDVFPVADALHRRGTPLIFHSGHAQATELQNKFPGAMALSKPAAERVLIDALVRTTATQ